MYTLQRVHSELTYLPETERDEVVTPGRVLSRDAVLKAPEIDSSEEADAEERPRSPMHAVRADGNPRDPAQATGILEKQLACS